MYPICLAVCRPAKMFQNRPTGKQPCLCTRSRLAQVIFPNAPHVATRRIKRDICTRIFKKHHYTVILQACKPRQCSVLTALQLPQVFLKFVSLLSCRIIGKFEKFQWKICLMCTKSVKRVRRDYCTGL